MNIKFLNDRELEAMQVGGAGVSKSTYYIQPNRENNFNASVPAHVGIVATVKVPVQAYAPPGLRTPIV